MVNTHTALSSLVDTEHQVVKSKSVIHDPRIIEHCNVVLQFELVLSMTENGMPSFNQ